MIWKAESAISYSAVTFPFWAQSPRRVTKRMSRSARFASTQLVCESKMPRPLSQDELVPWHV